MGQENPFPQPLNNMPAHWIQRPSAEMIATLPGFASLPANNICVLRTDADCLAAASELASSPAIGFDTESKPLFRKDAIQTGPHILQFATAQSAFLVQVDQFAPRDFLRHILESTALLKVGFGLNNDLGLLRNKLGIELQHHLDLGPVFRRLGYKDALGIKAAVAIVLGLRLRKSKKASTSNWASRELNAAQLSYAADDAYAALCVFNRLRESGQIHAG